MAKEKKILLSTLQVTLITLFIKFLGLVKQSVLASYCGATMQTDAFFIATGTMINLSTIIFSAISISFLTIHTNMLVKEGRKKSNNLVNAVLRVFIPISFCLFIIFYFGSSIISRILAPAYQGEELNLLSEYIKTMSSSFVLWCYFLSVNVVLETDKEFIQGKGQSFFQNLFLILGAILFYPKFGMKVLVYAFVFSGMAQCILVTWCARRKFKIVFGKISSYSHVRQLIKVALPLLLGNAMYEINTIVDGQVATSLGVGGASVLNYGATIHDMVIGVIVVSVSTVLFSHFSTWIAQNEIGQVEESFRSTLEILTLILLPVMVMCIVAGDQIITIFYGRGSFGAKEIKLTYGVVIGYSFGFIFQAARANIVKVYYAFQDSKRPMINGFIAIVLNVTLSIILSRFMGVAGIAAATSISMFFVTLMLFSGIKKYLPDFSLKESIREVTKGGVSAGITAVVIFFLKMHLDFGVFITFLIEGIVAIILYVVLLFVFKSCRVINALEFMKKKASCIF